jgi:hypothetical protein
VNRGPQFTEAVIEAIEARLRRGAPTRADARLPAPTQTTKPAPVPQQPETPPRSSSGPVPQVARQFTHGGLALGGSIEVLPEPLSPALGGRFEVGVGVGAVSFVLSESARVGSAPRGQSFGYDVGAGVAWGAPFDARYNFGAKTLIGVDWFSASGATANSASSSGVVELGGVAAAYVSDYALWFGIAGRYRMRPQTFGSPQNIELPHFSAMLSAGGAILVSVSRRSER